MTGFKVFGGFVLGAILAGAACGGRTDLLDDDLARAFPDGSFAEAGMGGGSAGGPTSRGGGPSRRGGSPGAAGAFPGAGGSVPGAGGSVPGAGGSVPGAGGVATGGFPGTGALPGTGGFVPGAGGSWSGPGSPGGPDIICGRQVCTASGAPVAGLELLACCTDSETCGLQAHGAFASLLGIGDVCQPRNQPGQFDPECPGSPVPLPLSGCCTPAGRCGVALDAWGLGCVASFSGFACGPARPSDDQPLHGAGALRL